MWFAGAAALAVTGAGAASAQELEIEDAVARVVVVPEARQDIQVSVTRGAPGLPPLTVRQVRSGVKVEGGLGRRIEGCDGRDGATSVRVRGVGRIPVTDLPLITARVPMNVEVSTEDSAVFGSIGRTQSLKLGSGGCGTWRAANVAGAAEISVAGSGDVMVGSVRQAELNVAGSGDLRLGPVGGSLEANIAGSGDIRVASVGGSVEANIAGSGDVVIESGRTGPVSASIAGSGDVRVAGAAASVNASIVGSGDVRVQQVSGSVRRSIMGSGDVIVGR
jgi:hypothetical protein